MVTSVDLAVLHANDWTGYLASQLFPEARILPWRADLACDDVLSWLAGRRGAGSAPSAFLFHVDLSDTRCSPRDRLRLLRGLAALGISALNGRCDDLSKRRLQARLAELRLGSLSIAHETAPDTPVIVKCDPNHGGESELRLSSEEREFLGIGFRGAWLRGAQRCRVLLLGEVPAHVLRDPDYVVERFVANAADVFFRVYIAGSAVLLVKAHSMLDVKTIGHDPRDENWALDFDDLESPSRLVDVIPESVTCAVREFVVAEELHFGCLDIVLDDGGAAYIVDLNTTPWAGRRPIDPEIGDHLREGLLHGVRRDPGFTARVPAYETLETNP